MLYILIDKRMQYKIKLADGTLQFIKITSAYFKAWHVWNIQVFIFL